MSETIKDENRADFLLELRAAIKRNQVVVMIMYNSEENKYGVWSNGYDTDFEEILNAFCEMPFMGRVSPLDYFVQWEDFFEDPALHEIYGFELEDGMVQIAILDYYIRKEIEGHTVPVTL
jgi:hypothetical protein